MSRDILLSQIDPDPNQPRKHFDQASIEELAQSMAANGLAVPVLVRPVGERYMLVHGERRWRAAQSLGWETIPAEVREVSEDEARWLSLVENVQRADLSPIEEARAYRAYLDTGITQVELGRRIGKSRTHITTMLRFLKLPEDIQEALAEGSISEGHAKQILRLEYPATQYAVCFGILRDDMTVAQTVKVVDAVLASPAVHWVLLTNCLERNIVELVDSFCRKYEQLHALFSDQGRRLKSLRADLKAEQFDLLFTAPPAKAELAKIGLPFDIETACDYIAFHESPTEDNITDRMWDHFWDSFPALRDWAKKECVT